MRETRRLRRRRLAVTRLSSLSGLPVEEQYTAIDGVSLRYLEAGKGNAGLPLLMLHGYQAGADLWFPHPLPALASTFHVIAPDLPGFGDSGPMPEYGTLQYASILFRFMNSLGYTRFDLLGHSMGGQIAIAMAASEPERIAHLLLVDSAGLPREGPLWMNPMRMMGDASMRHVRLYPTSLRLMAKSRALAEGLQMLQHDHIQGRLDQLTMPTLVIWGSRDRVVPLEHGAFMSKRIPHARLAVIRGAGHLPFYQKPAQFIKLARDFLLKSTEQVEGR